MALVFAGCGCGVGAVVRTGMAVTVTVAGFSAVVVQLITTD